LTPEERSQLQSVGEAFVALIVGAQTLGHSDIRNTLRDYVTPFGGEGEFEIDVLRAALLEGADGLARLAELPLFRNLQRALLTTSDERVRASDTVSIGGQEGKIRADKSIGASAAQTAPPLDTRRNPSCQ
jgi:hypothetical protein